MDRGVVALVAAFEEAARIAATVSAVQDLADEVVVVDDGSKDATTSAALVAGATVLRASRRRGKGRALEEALERLPPAAVWLLVDGDLEGTASRLAPLVDALRQGRADVAIAAFPELRGGGFGMVKGTAARLIRAACGFDAREPLSGQRALTAAALAAVRPLAPGFGVEVGMTIDAVRAGLRVIEIPIDGLSHRPTGRGHPRGGGREGDPSPSRTRRKMTVLEGVLAFGGGFALAALAWHVVQRAGPRWRKENRRGRSLPVALGWALAIGSLGLVAVIWYQVDRIGLRASQTGEVMGAAIVFFTGVVDDGYGGSVRGLRGHLRALMSGHVTTGGLKVAAAVLAAAIAVAWTPRDHLWANLLALIAIAGSTNIWNGLDVAPGRALKGFLVVATVLLAVDLKAFLLVCSGAATAVLVPDLRERGMLGDSGATLLGFLAGAEIVRRLPEPWLILAALLVVGLNVLAETITFSRTIETIPPLRWFDHLGRLPDEVR
jgi:hypothetical protein